MLDKATTQAGVVGGATVVTETGLLTVDQLNAIGFLGISLGAWIQLFLLISVSLVILLNLKKVYIEYLKPTYKYIRKRIKKLKY